MATQVMTLDPVLVSPPFYSVLLENEFVRVLDVHLPPGEKTNMHFHPDYVVYAMAASTTRFSLANGLISQLSMRPGQAEFRVAETHMAENVGSTDNHVINFELRNPTRPGGRPWALGPDLPDVAPQYCRTLLENSRCRLLEITVPPAATVPTHASPDQVVYPLEEGRMRLAHADGGGHDLVIQRGSAFFVRGIVCSVENIGETSVHVIKLDLLQ